MLFINFTAFIYSRVAKWTELFVVVHPAEANRDIMDWSGNKPLDYSRQRSSVSASTCSSEYAKYFFGADVGNSFRTLGFIESSQITGGTLGSALTRGKKRAQNRFATISGGSLGGVGGAVSRSQSMTVSRRPKKQPGQPISGIFKPATEDGDLLPCEMEGQPVPFRGASTRRKESFLRKTFRATAGGSRRPLAKDVFTNPPEHG